MGEALRAKDAAERKFRAHNLKGAWRSAVKAHNLCQSLEGISQMVATFEVHLASESKIDGESDWYRILALSSSADEEEVKKQYKKLVLLLHPDMNKSVGGETAFKLVSEAWSVLSDKSRKMLYDQKVRDHSIMNGTNSLYTYDKKANKRARKNAAAASTSAGSTVRPPGVDTFWTSCNGCRMQYEYLKIYLNHNLLCPNCQHAFMAVETGYPSNGASSSFSSIPGTEHGVYQEENTYGAYNNQSFQFNQYAKTTGAAAYNTQTLETAKRGNEENQIYGYFPSANEYQSGRGRHSNKRRNNSNGYASVGCTGETLSATADTTVTADAGRANGINADVTFGERHRSAVSGRKTNVLRDIFQLNSVSIRSLLIDKAKAAIREKLQDLSISTSTHFSEKGEAKQKEKHVANNLKVNGILSDNPMKKRRIHNTKDADVEIPASDEKDSEQKRVPVHIDVPDPDFHDFDKDRTEGAFGNDQVWATYDGEDSMPRLYAMVQKVISLKPFRIKMSFLNSKSNSELAPINWVASGFRKTCGDFRVGRYEITETVNIFSHRVNWIKGPRGIIKITPKKGDTWALYRNWSSDWNALTPDDVIYKYEIVEVIDDFTEEQGVNVIPLIKVADFKAVFHRHTGPDVVRRIPKEELFRFSHQVPSCLLTGEERNDAPKGCHELDPAATPAHLLEVITDVKEDHVLGVSMQNSTSLATEVTAAS
jgi:curved DNA-binding protein CbpA